MLLVILLLVQLWVLLLMLLLLLLLDLQMIILRVTAWLWERLEVWILRVCGHGHGLAALEEAACGRWQDGRGPWQRCRRSLLMRFSRVAGTAGSRCVASVQISVTRLKPNGIKQSYSRRTSHHRRRLLQLRCVCVCVRVADGGRARG